MAKKRKAIRTSAKLPQAKDERTKLTIDSWEDVADSGDEFQISRDKVLLEEGPARKKRRKLNEEYEELLPSDEDVLELPSEGEDGTGETSDGQDTSDDDASSAPGKQDQDEQDEAWGTSRRDYYNADNIETEADALEEEEEALRLQEKQLKGMTEADFGFDENEWLTNGQDEETANAKVEEILPQIEITGKMSPEEQTRILTSRYPEFQALGKEFVSLEAQYDDMLRKARHLAIKFDSSDLKATTPGTILKWRALGAYLGVLSMYFAVLTSGPVNEDGKHRTLSPMEVRKHPIMETLMQARMQWAKIKDLDLADPVLINGHSTDEVVTIVKQPAAVPQGKVQPEMRQENVRNSKSKARAAKAEQIAEAERAARAARLQKTKNELAQLADSSKAKSIQPATSQNHRTTNDLSDFGELPTSDTALQDRRKKSLAFYTSQIAAKTNKRNNASRGAGGDDDIPYKERFRDRVARLNAEATNRGQSGRDELGGASDEEDNRIAAEVRAQDDDDEDYYQTIASKTQIKKDQKAARAAATKEAASRGAQIREVETVGPDGKRAITYAIEKNKGLTPKRKKEARNPRVKKRLKYEEKMKKLGSIRQLYKGGEGRGGYGGETTGIKSGIVRSRKL